MVVVVVVAGWVSTADNDKDNGQAMECEANRLAVVWHELQIRVFQAKNTRQERRELKRRLAG